MLHVLENERDAEWVTYLDSDLFFFAPPDPIYDEMKDAAFGIIPHRFTRRLADQRRFGHLQCRLGQRPALRRRVRRIALVARTLHRVVLRPGRRRPLRRPALSRPATRAVSRTFTSSAISAPIWRHGISRMCASSGGTDRCGSKAVTRCCSFIFTASSAAGGTTSTAIGCITRRFTDVMRHRIYEPYTARSAAIRRRWSRPISRTSSTDTIRRPSVGAPQDHVLNVLRP